jgi:hypothetical protein
VSSRHGPSFRLITIALAICALGAGVAAGLTLSSSDDENVAPAQQAGPLGHFLLRAGKGESKIAASLELREGSVCIEGHFPYVQAAFLIDARSRPVLDFVTPIPGSSSLSNPVSRCTDALPDGLNATVLQHPDEYLVLFGRDDGSYYTPSLASWLLSDQDPSCRVYVRRECLGKKETLPGIDRELPLENRGCRTRVAGKGLERGANLPPKPYFEVFNTWTSSVPGKRSKCLIIRAGQQQTHTSEGENDRDRYRSRGALFLQGHRLHPGGIGWLEVPLPRPVRIVRGFGQGYEATLILQSLADCSVTSLDVRFLYTAQVDRKYPCPAN